MYWDLSEKGAIIDRLDLEFLFHLNARTVGNPATPRTAPLLVCHSECGMCMSRKPECIQRSAIVNRFQIESKM
jgi:hypothetical protein